MGEENDDSVGADGQVVVHICINDRGGGLVDVGLLRPVDAALYPQQRSSSAKPTSQSRNMTLARGEHLPKGGD